MNTKMSDLDAVIKVLDNPNNTTKHMAALSNLVHNYFAKWGDSPYLQGYWIRTLKTLKKE